MSDFAQLTMSGRLGRDPEMKQTPNGHTVVTFSVASSRKAGDREFTFWANVEAWGKLAELLNERLSKGDQIVFTARPRTDSWEADGGKRSRDIYTIDQLLSFQAKAGSKNSNSQEMPY